MLCRKPYIKGVLSYGCGQCMPCRVNRRRLWTHRILLETFLHEKSCFVTLTYSPEKVPDGGTLEPSDLRNFFKRLRKRCAPTRVRYFGVGEYGDATQRAHYHAAIFGLGEEDVSAIESAWGKGFVSVGSLTKDSAQYICGYVCKKLTNAADPSLNGRYPEFARMSRRPGIGAGAMNVVADALCSNGGVLALEQLGDVPSKLKHGLREIPIGRYLKSKLRLLIGGDDGALQMQESAKERHLSEALSLFAAKPKNVVFRDYLFALGKQKALNLEGKLKIQNSKKGI